MVMADEPIIYDVDADNKFKEAMKKAAASGLDLSFSMGESVRIIKKETTKNFTLKGFGKYDPLNPKYLKRKLKLAPGAPILTGAKPGGGVSGKLKKSIIGTTSDSIINIGKRSIEYGTKAKSKKGAPYPRWIQEGTKKMPARSFLFFSKNMVKQIINTINADIGNQI